MTARPAAVPGPGVPVVGGPVPGAEELTRSLLARQHLLARSSDALEDVVGHLVGLQAQNPSSPYTALWSRVAGFSTDALSQALLDRRLVRIAVMRGTIHLVTAADALVLPALLEPLLAGSLRRNPTYAKPLRDVDLSEVAAVARDLVEAEPLTPAELGARLAERWDTEPTALAQAARGTLPLVQVTPRGVWGQPGATRWTTSRAWLGRPPADLTDPQARAEALDAMVLRYLASFGPASVADAQTWSGLTGLRRVFDRLRPRLTVLGPATPRGRELFDVAGAPAPTTHTPPPRLLPDYDNLVLSHADRTRVIDEEHRRRLWSPNGVTPGKVLVGGRVRGTWRLDASGVSSPATLTVTPLDAWEGADVDAVVAEAHAYLAFARDGSQDDQVVVAAG